MELMIRQMEPHDISRVAKLEADIFSMPWSEKGFEDSLQLGDTLYLVAYAEEELVGYCGLLQSFEEAEITNVAVRESVRGQGVGYQMLSKLLEDGEKRGIERFILEVRVSNIHAIHLYERLGFEKIGIRKRFYEKPVEDAMIMWKDKL